MKIYKPLKQGLLTKIFEEKKRYYLVTTVLTFFSLDLPSQLFTEIDLWKFAGEALGKDVILDLGMPKPRGEVLVTGKFFARGGVPGLAGQVRLKLGMVEKKLDVFGDRFWNRAAGTSLVISDPKPMTVMHISYENAFGGPDYKENPLGKGYGPVKTDKGEEVYPLPNIEKPGHLIGSPKDRPEPAGFGPLDQMWPQRFSKVGTYDDKWLQERFPGFPGDFDWTFFNAAPEDQQLTGYFSGDETVEIEGMHPEKSKIAAKLPGILSRCFVNQKAGEEETFKEIKMRPDTVWLFPHYERGVLIYRGVTEAANDEAEDVLQVLVAYERLADEPRSLEHYHQALLKRNDKEKGYLHLINEKDLIPIGERSAIRDLIEGSEPNVKKESIFQKNMKRRMEREREKAREKLKESGLDPNRYLPEPPSSVEFDIEKLDELDAYAERMMSEAKTQQAEAEAKSRALFKELGMDYDQVVKEAKEKGGGRPKFSAEETIKRLRGQGISDPETEKKIYQMEDNLNKAYREYGHYFPPAPRPSHAEINRMREAVVSGYRRGESFAGMDLTGIDLSDLDLKGIDLKEAFLEGANLSGSDLGNAHLTGCLLVRANLSYAIFSSAKMKESNMGQSNLCGADLREADLTKAVIARADLSKANLSGAKMEETDLSESKLHETDLSRACLTKARFMESDLTAATLAEADLSESLFLNAKLEEVDFSMAKLVSVIFVGVKGDRAIFKKADLTNLRALMETSLQEANFQGASLVGANLMGANLAKSHFELANISAADFSQSNLESSSFYRAVAKQARFRKSNLAGANMVSINLFEGSLEKARLVDADLRGANLYSVNFLKAVLGNTNLDQANLKKTVLSKWRPA